MRSGRTSGCPFCRWCSSWWCVEWNAVESSRWSCSGSSCLASTERRATCSFPTSGRFLRSQSSFWPYGRIDFSAPHRRNSMPLNPEVSFTWLGHGTWKARSAKGIEVLIDPWVMNNPVTPAHLKTVDKCDLMLITHAHFDHIGDALRSEEHT